MIGPRDSVVRMMLGEDVSLEELLRDQSEFVDTESPSWRNAKWYDSPPEFWAHKVRDFVYEED